MGKSSTFPQTFLTHPRKSGCSLLSRSVHPSGFHAKAKSPRVAKNPGTVGSTLSPCTLSLCRQGSFVPGRCSTWMRLLLTQLQTLIENTAKGHWTHSLDPKVGETCLVSGRCAPESCCHDDLNWTLFALAHLFTFAIKLQMWQVLLACLSSSFGHKSPSVSYYHSVG